jgi:hypothetical protein
VSLVLPGVRTRSAELRFRSLRHIPQAQIWSQIAGTAEKAPAIRTEFMFGLALSSMGKRKNPQAPAIEVTSMVRLTLEWRRDYRGH